MDDLDPELRDDENIEDDEFDPLLSGKKKPKGLDDDLLSGDESLDELVDAELGEDEEDLTDQW